MLHVRVGCMENASLLPVTDSRITNTFPLGLVHVLPQYLSYSLTQEPAHFGAARIRRLGCAVPVPSANSYGANIDRENTIIIVHALSSLMLVKSVQNSPRHYSEPLLTSGISGISGPIERVGSPSSSDTVPNQKEE